MLNVTVVPPQEIPSLARAMEGWRGVVVDTETTGPEPQLSDVVVGIGVCSIDEDRYFYISTADVEGKPTLNALDLRPLIQVLQIKPLVGHNIKFDLHGLTTFDWKSGQDAFMDTIVMARLWATELHPILGLKPQAKTILGYVYEAQDVIKGVKKGQIYKLPVDRQAYYNAEDLFCTKGLYWWYKERLAGAGLLPLFKRECRLTRDLYDIEQRGFLIDEEYLETATRKLDGLIEQHLSTVQKQSGMENFNPASPLQIQELMKQLEIKPVAWSDKTGKASWNRESLVQVRHQHPVAMQLARYRALAHVRDGVIQRCHDALKAGSKEMYGELKNWGTVTGRMSGDTQQFNKGWLQLVEEGGGGDKVISWADGPEQEISVRRCFKPHDGYEFVVADYKQIEMFGLGFYMKDNVFNAWLESEDVHAAAARDVWPQEYLVDPNGYRAKGKEYNFSMVYGIGDKLLAVRTGMTVEEAAMRRRQYFTRIPGFPRFQRKVKKLLKDQGWVRNLYGRVYWLDPELAYKAVNYLVQGSSGDFVKFRLPESRAYRRASGIHVFNTTHDDFFMESPLDGRAALLGLFKILGDSPFGRQLEMDVNASGKSLMDLEKLDVA